jgi:hypothetical protein
VRESLRVVDTCNLSARAHQLCLERLNQIVVPLLRLGVSRHRILNTVQGTEIPGVQLFCGGPFALGGA